MNVEATLDVIDFDSDSGLVDEKLTAFSGVRGGGVVCFRSHFFKYNRAFCTFRIHAPRKIPTNFTFCHYLHFILFVYNVNRVWLQ